MTTRGVLRRCARGYTPLAPANFRCWKHSLQKTGRPCVGRKGTVVSLPHAEHWVCVSTRLETDGPALTRLARLALHALQRLGSFLNCLSAKKSCSPAVQMKSDPQSTHANDLSWNSVGRHPALPPGPAPVGLPAEAFPRRLVYGGVTPVGLPPEALPPMAVPGGRPPNDPLGPVLFPTA